MQTYRHVRDNYSNSCGGGEVEMSKYVQGTYSGVDGWFLDAQNFERIGDYGSMIAINWIKDRLLRWWILTSTNLLLLYI